VSSLQSVLSVSQLSNRLNLLTPSLAKFFRADLITHVTNWPSEVLEKQVRGCFRLIIFCMLFSQSLSFFRHKSVQMKCTCWATWSVVKFQLKFSAHVVSCESQKLPPQFKHKGKHDVLSMQL
jgi:hypothetical protein